MTRVTVAAGARTSREECSYSVVLMTPPRRKWHVQDQRPTSAPQAALNPNEPTLTEMTPEELGQVVGGKGFACPRSVMRHGNTSQRSDDIDPLHLTDNWRRSTFGAQLTVVSHLDGVADRKFAPQGVP